jgi:hypothetical protein
MARCLECAGDFHNLCERGGCSNCHEIQEGPNGADVETLSDEDLSAGGFRRLSPDERKTGADRRRTSERTKNDRQLKDPHSTGRKRAVTLHGHADPTQPCEWQGKANCGGGRFPILGCVAGVQENLHHGPDKNTLNNERTNIHKICSQCHNRWHTLNDVDYEWDGVHEPHSPREPERADVLEDNKRWQNRTVKRAPKE